MFFPMLIAITDRPRAAIFSAMRRVNSSQHSDSEEVTTYLIECVEVEVQVRLRATKTNSTVFDVFFPAALNKAVKERRPESSSPDETESVSGSDTRRVMMIPE